MSATIRDVAKLAGVPDSVINRAKELVEQLVDSDLTARTREIAEGSEGIVLC